MYNGFGLVQTLVPMIFLLRKYFCIVLLLIFAPCCATSYCKEAVAYKPAVASNKKSASSNTPQANKLAANSASKSELNTSADATANRPIKDKWAVVIGISKFANSTIPVLKYPSKDAKDFRDFLVSKGNFAPDHVLLLTDEKASREKILEAFGDGWLPKRVMEDDLVVVFISSHGSAADRAGENFIIAYDSNPEHPYSTSIRLQDLASEVTKRTGCDRLVLLLDACHSGAAVDGEKGLTRSKTNFDLNAITGTGQLVISSSKPDQVSWESKRYPNGVFTHNLIDALQVNGPSTKIDNAYKALKDKVELEVRYDRTEGQTPMMMSKWKGENLALCAVPSEPRKIPFAEEPEPVSTITGSSNSSSSSQSNLSSSSLPSTAPDRNSSSSSRPDTSYDPRRPDPSYDPRRPDPRYDSRRPDPNYDSRRPAPSYDSRRPASNYDPVRRPIDPRAAEAAERMAEAKERTENMRAARPRRELAGTPMMTTTWTNDHGDPKLERGTRMLLSSELSGLSYQQLVFMYNEPYARHGRGFEANSIQEYFNSQSWYSQDPDYHWKRDDPKVVSRGGQPDDPLIINPNRTPIQYTNMQIIKRQMNSIRDRSRQPAPRIGF